MRKVLNLPFVGGSPCSNLQETEQTRTGRRALSWAGITGRDLHIVLMCLGSRQEVYLLQDHHVDQRDAFWQVPQVSNIVVQKIVLTKEKEKRTDKLSRDFWSQSQPNT